MFSARRSSLAFAGVGLAAALLLATSCSDTDPSVTGILLKPAVGAVKVNLTDPPGAPQETTIDVYVLGSGFDDGSEATFMLDGLPNPKVSTNSNHFVSQDTLIANISIAGDADTALYDVEVLTARGKKGIGVDLFRVVKKGDTVGDIPITAEYRDDVGDRIGSDGGGAYVGIFRENRSIISSTVDKPRTLCFDFPEIADASLFFPEDGCYDGYVSTHTPGIFESDNIYVMPVDEMEADTSWTAAGLHWDGGLFHFGTSCTLDAVPENRLWATHPDEATWKLGGEGAIVCRNRLPGEKAPKLIQVEVDVPFAMTLRLVNEP